MLKGGVGEVSARDRSHRPVPFSESELLAAWSQRKQTTNQELAQSSARRNHSEATAGSKAVPRNGPKRASGIRSGSGPDKMKKPTRSLSPRKC